MEPYLKEYIFEEEMTVHPHYLNGDLNENLKVLITNKYSKIYKNKGYLFNIKIDSILDNKITLSGQIIFKIRVKADIYSPQIGHVFKAPLKKSINNKFQWVEIGPLTIHLKEKKDLEEDATIKITITDIKPDNSLCLGTC